MRTEEHTYGHTHYRTYARQQIHTVSHSNGGTYRKKGHTRERKNIRESVGFIRDGTIGGDEGQPREM